MADSRFPTPITIYGFIISPPVRASILVCEALGIKYIRKDVNLLAGEQFAPEYLEMNPIHTIPTIKDGDFVLFDSHAIASYLGEKSGLDSWYPKDLQKKSIVLQRLHFNNSVLLKSLAANVRHVLLTGATALDADNLARVGDALSSLDALIGDKQWLADDHPTVADCCSAAVTSSIVTCLPGVALPLRVAAWLSRCEATLPNYAVNKEGAEALGAMMQEKLASSK